MRRLQFEMIGVSHMLASSNEDFLYRLFGIDAELLIDHAWGRLAYYNAFDEYHVKHNLDAMEKLFAGYVNTRLENYLEMLEE